MNRTYSLSELNEVAKEIIATSNHKTLLFYGQMGVGKTTLIKEICKILGIDDVTSSPTFSIVNEYITNKSETVYHFDFYRIEQEEEAFDIGVEDYFYSDTWSLIEWPENVQNLLPLNSVEIHLTQLDDHQRKIQLKQPI